VQAKETVEIENLVRRNCDPWTQGVVILLTVRDDDIEAIRRPALEDDNEPLARFGCSLGHDGTDEEAGERGNGRGAGDGQCALVQEESSVGLHGVPSLTLRQTVIGAETLESRARARRATGPVFQGPPQLVLG
jgi:hypothetical protein